MSGILGTGEHHRLGNLCGAAATDPNVGRRVIVNEDALTVAGADGHREVSPDPGWVSVLVPVDGYHAVGAFLQVSVIEEGGDNLRRRIDELGERAARRAAGRRGA